MQASVLVLVADNAGGRFARVSVIPFSGSGRDLKLCIPAGKHGGGWFLKLCLPW